MITSIEINDQSAELCRVLEYHIAEFVSLGLFSPLRIRERENPEPPYVPISAT